MPEPLEQRDVPLRSRGSGRAALPSITSASSAGAVDLRAGDRLQCRGRAGVVIVPVGEQDLGDTHVLLGSACELGQGVKVGALIPHDAAVEEDEPGRLPDRVDRDDRGATGSRASRWMGSRVTSEGAVGSHEHSLRVDGVVASGGCGLGSGAWCSAVAWSSASAAAASQIVQPVSTITSLVGRARRATASHPSAMRS